MIGNLRYHVIAIALTLIVATNCFAQHKGGARPSPRPTPTRPPVHNPPAHTHAGPATSSHHGQASQTTSRLNGSLGTSQTTRLGHTTTARTTIVVRPLVSINVNRVINTSRRFGTISELETAGDAAAIVGSQSDSIIANEGYGLKIVEVYKDGGAAKGQLMPNDIIFELGEVRMNSIEQLQKSLEGVNGIVRVVFRNCENGKMESTDVVIRDGVMGVSLVEVEVN